MSRVILYIVNLPMHIHLWVYGIYIQDDKVLMIKKSRWPYTWMYDLPGGGIEYGETIEVALARELDEEVWATLTSSTYIWNNEYIAPYISATTGLEKMFHHIWIYYTVDLVIESLKTEPDWHDSLGAVWVNVSDLSAENVSPIALPMILQVV